MNIMQTILVYGLAIIIVLSPFILIYKKLKRKKMRNKVLEHEYKKAIEEEKKEKD